MKASKKSTVENVTDKAKELGSQLVAQASEAVESGKEDAVQRLEEGKENAVSQVRDLNDALRATANRVDSPVLGKQIARLADGVERAASTLESTEYEDVIRTVERLSRSNPTLFLAGSFTLGLVASRFFRATSHRAIPHNRALAVNGTWPR